MSRPRLVAADCRWPGRTVVVAATGPSLTPEVAAACREHPAIAVNDAWRLMPWADVLYSCDGAWWGHHKGCPDFAGEKWSSHDAETNNKGHAAECYGLRLIEGRAGDIFSTDPSLIHYGSNSGFQAVGLAILFGASRIVLVGFNMQAVAGRRHFFGDHPRPLRNVDHSRYVAGFKHAARHLPPGVEILNATPQSALTCFPSVPLEKALERRETAAA